LLKQTLEIDGNKRLILDNQEPLGRERRLMHESILPAGQSAFVKEMRRLDGPPFCTDCQPFPSKRRTSMVGVRGRACGATANTVLRDLP